MFKAIVGVVTALPTVGVAKNLHQLQELGPQFARDSVSSRLEQDSGRHVTLATAEVGQHCVIIILNRAFSLLKCLIL